MLKKIIILLGLGVFLVPLVATAQTKMNIPTNSLKAIAAPKATTTAEVKGVLARCAIVESKMQVKSTNFDNNKVKHLDVYSQVKSRLVVITDNLATQGLDVAPLRADLAIYDQKIKKFSDDYATYIGILKDSQAYACGKSEVQFRARFKEAKTALAQVHQDAVAVQIYYAQTLKPEVNRLKAVLRGDKATSTAVTSTATTTEPSNNN